jgi:selenide,water dikinase
MARASKVTILIEPTSVPLLDGALELAAAGMLTSGDKTNREYIGEDIEIRDAVDKNLIKLLYDPQTAGGMLISIAEDRANDLLARLREHYPQARKIGRVVARGARSIVVSSV